MHSDHAPYRRAVLCLLAFSVLALAAPAQKHRGKVPKVAAHPDGAYTRLELESGGVGFLYVPADVPKSPESLAAGAARPGLLVVLHGHGSTAKNMMRPPLANAHGDYMLAVQGGTPIAAEGREGFGWDGSGVATISDLVRYVLATHPVVDPKKVVLLGHSAGGTMVLEAYPAAPKLYAGLITIAAPRTPTSAHKNARVCVFLGTADPNFNGAPAVRNALGGKRRWKSGCLVVLQGAEHNHLPQLVHLILAIDWCLAGKAHGAEVEVSNQPLPEAAAPYRLLLVGYVGAADWDDPRDTKRKKEAAKKLAGTVARDCAKGAAFFPLEVLAHSDHAASSAAGGRIDSRGLEELDPKLGEAAAALEPGARSEVIDTPKGFAVIQRIPPAR
ncbi:MAG: alpha/beta fold hydrolase [Planctomycetes bacterium]|nr:alpha/beta fold hydrolase [Planctomycetota bacterium]